MPKWQAWLKPIHSRCISSPCMQMTKHQRFFPQQHHLPSSYPPPPPHYPETHWQERQKVKQDNNKNTAREVAAVRWLSVGNRMRLSVKPTRRSVSSSWLSTQTDAVYGDIVLYQCVINYAKPVVTLLSTLLVTKYCIWNAESIGV